MSDLAEAGGEAHAWRPQDESRGPIHALRSHLANYWSVRVLRLAHQRAAPMRLLLGCVVGIVWFSFGLAAALSPAPPAPTEHVAGAPSEPHPLRRMLERPILGFSNAVCVIQSGKRCSLDEADLRIRLSQSALSALTILTLVFGFWAQLLGAVSHALRAIGAGHIVVTGSGAEAETLARDIARPRKRGRRAVTLLRRTASAAEADAMAADGVVLLAAPPSDSAMLRDAGVQHADRIVAISASESENLAVAAAVTRARKRVLPGDVLIRIEDDHARRDLVAHGGLHSADVFSLAQIAARQALRRTVLLEEADRRGVDCMHVAIVGWDDTAIAFATGAFRMLWAAGKQPPRVTVFTPEPERCEAQYKARHPAAFVSPMWIADISFRDYDWESLTDPWAPLDAREQEPGGGPLIGVLVSWPKEEETLRCAAVLAGRARGGDRPPLLVRETKDGTIAAALASAHGGRLIPIGAPSDVLASEALIDRKLDEAARLVHSAYIETCILDQNAAAYARALESGRWRRRRRDDDEPPPNTATITALERAYCERRGERGLNELRRGLAESLLESGAFRPNPNRPAQRPWSDLADHHITANRTAADHALVKLWGLGWRPARRNENGGIPKLEIADISNEMCELEHLRWAADLMLSGWRYGPRNDYALTHPDLRPYADFPADEIAGAIAKDRGPWLAAPRIGCETHERGFVPKAPPLRP